MTHLYIEQNPSLIEEVSSSLITKLYNLIINETLDSTSSLKGRLHIVLSFKEEILYLTNSYPELYITSDEYAIKFEDPKMMAYLNSIGVGSNGVVTMSQAAAATVVANSANTEITKFNELKYFTNITTGKGGLYSNSTGTIRFVGWTSLEEVDISNFTSISHPTVYEDSFALCSSLSKVTASSNLTDIGTWAFRDCSSLTTISGLSGNITLYGNENFKDCRNLTSDSFSNVTFSFDNNNKYAFKGCTSLTQIAVNPNNLIIPQETFRGCSNLTTITGLDNVTTIGNSAFLGCSSLTSINLSSVTTIGTNAFYGTGLTGSITLSSCTSYPNGAFNSCSGITEIHAPNVLIMDNDNTVFLNMSNIRILDFPLCSVCPNCENISSLVVLNFPSANTIGDSANFAGCSNLTTFNVPLSIFTEIRGWMFENCSGLNGQTFDFGTTVTNIGPLAFQDTSINLIFRNTSVIPTELWDGRAWANYSGLVYVPDNLVSSYLAAREWSRISNLIKGISELPSS